jgi:PmbA protein
MTGWLLNAASAGSWDWRRTATPPAALAARPASARTNVHLEPGTMSPSELISDIKRGLYVTELIGQGG